MREVTLVLMCLQYRFEERLRPCFLNTNPFGALGGSDFRGGRSKRKVPFRRIVRHRLKQAKGFLFSSKAIRHGDEGLPSLERSARCANGSSLFWYLKRTGAFATISFKVDHAEQSCLYLGGECLCGIP